MNKDKPSSTAIGAAMLRAAHQIIDEGHKLLEDPVIVKLIGEDAQEDIRERRDYFYLSGVMALRTHIVLRSRYTEDRLFDACKAGITQFLILGAGLDTFAYRQPDWANKLRIVEADHPASQANKMALLADACIVIPDNLFFLKVDLEHDDLPAVFKQSDLDLNKPLFVSCLGVLIYLTRATISKIFRFIGSLPKGTEFIFTVSSKRTDTWLATTATKVANAGEPWISDFDFDMLESQLKESGFREVIFLEPAEAKQRYFTGTDLCIPPPQKCSIVRAVV